MKKVKVEDFRKLSVGEFIDLLLLLAGDNTEKVKINNLLLSEDSIKEFVDEDQKNLKLKLLQQNTEHIRENNQLIDLFNKIFKFEKEIWRTVDYEIEQDVEPIKKEVEIKETKPKRKKLWFWQKQDNSGLSTVDIRELNKQLKQFIREEKYEECKKIQRVINKKSKPKTLLNIRK